MSNKVPVLSAIDVQPAGDAVGLTWRWSGSLTIEIRVLRSTQCGCESPLAHMDGSWDQELMYDGVGSGVLDDASSRSEDVYYSIFARFPGGKWRRPVHVVVRRVGAKPPPLGRPAAGSAAPNLVDDPRGRYLGGRWVETHGGEEGSRAMGGRREWGLFIVPTVTLTVLVGFMGGLDARLISPVALALVVAWRLIEGPRPDHLRFVRTLMVAGIVAALFWSASLMFWYFAPSGMDSLVHGSAGARLAFWSYPFLLLAALVCAWALAGRTFDDHDRPTKLPAFVALGVFAVVLAVAPVAGCVALLAIGAILVLRKSRTAGA